MEDHEQSRNAWITKDDPKLVSGKHKDMFDDILDDRRHSSDFRWFTRSRDVPNFKLNKPRSPDEIKEHVMNSDRVKYAIEQVCKESNLPLSEVTIQAKSILDEMAHNLRLGAVRSFAYFLIKAMKKLFKRIYVNDEGVQKVREIIKDYPVLVMPTHRSYLDFLLVSFIFYNYDLPLPAIAAAMDFMGMKFFGWLLRNCGAFYIRRSFGDDQLYWAVFTEYVQTQIANGDNPVSFYVEGTRSRTQKSYAPRLGMLQASLETYFKSHTPDIMIIPISISYDRVLEESLYAYELLGVPKPKESTSGLLKARSILQEDFGCVHMFFGDPISIRQYSDGKVDRSSHNLAPRYIASLSQEEQELIRSLSHHIILKHQKNMVISPWSLIASILVQCKEGITISQLIKEVEWLKRQASSIGGYIDWPGNETAEAVTRHSIALHSNIVRVSEEDIVELLHIPRVSTNKTDPLFQTAAQHIMLSLYRNQLMHIFARVAIISSILNGCRESTLSIDDLYTSYTFLETLLNRDFIFQPGHSKIDFEQALLTLTHSCGVIVENKQVLVEKSVNKHTTYFSQMFEPFLIGYWILCRYLLSMDPNVHGKPLSKPPKSIIKDAQSLSARLITEGVIRHYEVLSLDMMNNALNSFYFMGAVRKEKRDGITYMYPSMTPLSQITQQLVKCVDVPPLPSVSINVDAKTVTVNAKL
ncbi:hypothetical protein LOTGIDRAFT_159917 [Lottia gigantea]|uniref:Phospholipid/glycerol acyltransferase domain-containing protein n=1 Tax=Lottia gigantea TaxID=225164 RepID=V4ANY5_LOTGI|nr:hypothetical protein LOTGIDRAFT_159917 [Lottia gigantea]ESO96500.1 hypothetical protein LOTGIDRAFT_159917 [Lottia gigantea]